MERNTKNKTLTLCAMMTALGLLCLLMAAMMPGMRLAFTAIAGVVASIAVVHGNLGYGLLTVVATAILALFLVPAKEIVLLYVVFFGPYTLIKNLIERIKKLPVEWVLKLLFCAADAALLFLFADQVAAMVPEMLKAHIWLFLPAVLVAFAAYDLVFSTLIAYVFKRLHI